MMVFNPGTDTFNQSWGKTCTKCGLYKPLGEFSPAGKYFHSRCKPCRSEDANEKYTSENRFLRNIKEHGLTIERYNEMLNDQGGRCAICGKSAERLYVDHDHSCCPGKKSCGFCVRGLLCHKCNHGIGLFEDNRKFLQSAITYLLEASRNRYGV